MQYISGIIESVNGVLWGAPMIALMLATGAYFSVRTGFFQLRRPRDWLGRTVFSGVRQKRSENGVTPFEAMSSALAATLGTGNIAGVAAALASGGAGAVFWMWVSALLGMMTGYAENVLGHLYRRRNPDGSFSGGAMYYIRDGLGERRFGRIAAKPLAAVFAGACVLSAFGMGNLVQMNCAAGALESGFGIPEIASGIILAAIIGAVLFLGKTNGAQRTAAVTSRIVPLLSLLYIAAAVYILAENITRLPSVFGAVFRGAFGLEAAAGGVNGYMIKQAAAMGIRRGVFSNEAGLGSSVAAHASSDTADPHVQGMWSMFEVFFDTIVMCSMTAFVLLGSPCSAAARSDVFMNITTTPQYFRLTDADSLVTSGEKMPIISSDGEQCTLRTERGDEIDILLGEGGITYSNVMKITGVQSRGENGELLWKNGGALIETVRIEEVTGAELMTLAFSGAFGSAAGKLLSAAVALFAFATVVGWSSFGAQAAQYLAGKKAAAGFGAVYTLLAAVGGVVDMTAAWGAADMFNGLMAIINLPTLLVLSNKVIAINRQHNNSSTK